MPGSIQRLVFIIFPAVLLISSVSLTCCKRANQEPVTLTPTPEATATSTPWEPTPTRTRPVRSFFIRPTLAESPTPIEVPYPQPGEEDLQTPTLSPMPTLIAQTADLETPSATPTPTITGIAPTPARETIARPLLIDFAMFDPNHGWGLTEDKILRTSIGGTQWVDTTPMGFNPFPQSVPFAYFADPNHAWTLITRMNDISGTLFKTENGGNTWQTDPVPFTNARFFFLPGNNGNYANGWAMVDRSFTANSQAVDLYATLDGGETWNPIHTVNPTQGNQSSSAGALPYTGFKNGLTFLSPLRGWITGESPIAGMSWLYITNDGGKNWSEQVLSLPTGAQTNTVITEPPFFFNAQQGLLPVRLEQISDLTVLYETVDGGLTWSFTTPVPIAGQIDCVSPSTCRVWNGRVLAATENGGGSWRQVTTNVDLSNAYFQIDFVDPLFGFAMSIEYTGLTTRNTLYLTTDGGSTWIALW
jgi:photosystem II stability/assembly factor-like uncharacterized protein